MAEIHQKIVERVPQLRRGRVWCYRCGKACHARICGVEGFIGSDCCEGYLLRRVTDSEIGTIYADLDADEPRSAAENARLKVMGGV